MKSIKSIPFLFLLLTYSITFSQTTKDCSAECENYLIDLINTSIDISKKIKSNGVIRNDIRLEIKRINDIVYVDIYKMAKYGRRNSTIPVGFYECETSTGKLFEYDKLTDKVRKISLSKENRLQLSTKCIK